MADSPVVAAIVAATNDIRVREAMLLGSSMEGGWGPNYAAGDNNTSFGPYQMHIGGALTSAGGTPAQANDPKWATSKMLGQYTAAVNAQSSNLWLNNPELAAEQSAVAAERPARSYIASSGQKNVDAKWAQVQQALSGNVPTATAPVDTNIGGNLPFGIGDSISSIAGTLTGIGKAVDTIMTFITSKLFLPSTWARVLAFNVGAVLILVGLWLFFSQPGAAANVASGAAGIAKVAAK